MHESAESGSRSGVESAGERLGQADERSIAARIEYEYRALTAGADAVRFGVARATLDRAEAAKARIMSRIDRLEAALFGE